MAVGKILFLYNAVADAENEVISRSLCLVPKLMFSAKC